MPAVSGLLDKPCLGPLKVDLRPYQDEAIGAVRAEFARGVKRTLMVMFTGGGKTITFGMIVRKCIEKGGRVLILAHRKELIDQAANKLDLLGVEVGIERAEHQARSLYEPDAVVATVQTLRGDRLESWPRDHFRMIIVDEAHHAVADSYRRILAHFSPAYVLGVTATADRADEESLSKVFQSIAFEMNLWDGMTAPEPGPYLSRLKFVQCDVDIDLRDLRVKGDDFTDEDLEARIGPLVEVLANAIRQEAGDRRTLIFTPQVKSSQAMATALQSMGIAADWVSGDDPDRDAKVARFRSGEIRILSNVGIFTEGVDVPEISAIALCRPTRSRPLYSQIVGRGTRLAPGKDSCLLIDFNFLTAKHDLVKPVDLFDSTHIDGEVLNIAQGLVEKDRDLDLAEAIERAEEEHKRRTVLRVKAREREVKYRKVSYDPLAVYETLGLPWRGSRSPNAVINKATPRQVQALTNMGIDGASDMSRTRASTLLDYLGSRRKRGLATLKQTSWLIAKGVDPETARAMTFQEASDALSRIFGERRTG